MSSTSTRLFFSVSGTSPLTMRCARPSTIAVLPTPGSPISTGLFLVRRCRIWMQRRISSSRPITGSSLPGACAFGQVERVLRERLPLRLVGLPGHVLAAAHFLDGLFERGFRDARLLENPSAFALVARRREQEQLGGDVLVAALLRFLVGDVEQLRELARDVHFARGAFDLGQARDGVGKTLLQRSGIAAGLGDQADDAAVLLLEQRREQVLRLDVLVVAAQRRGSAPRRGPPAAWW